MSTPSSPAQTTVPVNERVAALVNDVIRDAAAARADDLGERLRAEAGRWRSKEVTVVIAGEPNRGKSTLVNAMLGRPVLPSGAEQVTTTFAIIRRGQPEKATVHRLGAESQEVALDELAPWMTAATREAVEGVSIDLDHPLLSDGLVLVDSPGVGGLDAAHGRVTLTVLSRADALVFVLDPSEPLSRTELTFLERATDRIERVVFVVPKVDTASGWRTIADDDRVLLARHAPRFAGAPVVPVSARLKVMADELAAAGTPDPSLVDESGVPALGRELLRTVVGRVTAVRLANLLRLTASAVGALEAPWQAAIAAAEGEPEAKAEVERAQVQLDELRETSERLAVDVTDRFNALRETANADFTRLLRELTATFAGEGADSSGDSLLDDLHAELRAGCAELGESLALEVQRIADEVASALGDVEILLPELALGAPEVGRADGLDEPGVTGGGDQMMRMRIASSVSSGGMALAMFGGRLGADPVLMGFMGATAVLGLATAAINVRLMRRQRDVAVVRKHVQEALEAARGEVSPAVRQQILGAQRELERTMRAAVRARTKHLQEVVTESTKLARADAAERQRRRDEAQRALAQLSARRQQVDALVADVRALLVPQAAAVSPDATAAG